MAFQTETNLCFSPCVATALHDMERKSYWYGNGAAHSENGRWAQGFRGWPATLLCADTSELEICAMTRIRWTAETLWSHLEASQVESTPPELASSSQPIRMSSLGSSGLPTRAG